MLILSNNFVDNNLSDELISRDVKYFINKQVILNILSTSDNFINS